MLLRRLLLLVALRPNSCTDFTDRSFSAAVLRRHCTSSFGFNGEITLFQISEKVLDDLPTDVFKNTFAVCAVLKEEIFPGPAALLSVVLSTEAVDCCHRDRQPITRSEQQGVGSDHLEPQEEQYPRLLPSLCLACFWLPVGGHVSSQLCRLTGAL